MKKIILGALASLFIMCSPIKTEVRDDFRSSSEQQKKVFLKEVNGTSDSKSVLILTKGYKGEKIMATQESKTVYSKYPITNLKTHLADYFSFENSKILIITDNFSKQEVVIEPKKATKYKFIYLRKDYEKDVATYKITFSNTLRAM
ncbi:hypothetical protein [Flavobacterium sp.]|jgi:hypothetical protein|uniref:hypothetical protein n=1 Tax=Flavobacterium sp. TaxID=239 RepID=UPI002A827E67|nr:hypothetical protein [Flavobacterium sp.]